MAKNLNVFDPAYQLLINGEWTNGSEGKTLTSYNPSNNQALATFIDASDADVDAAVAAAQEALKTWRHTTVTERSAILWAIADVIEQNSELLALQETLDNGKPIRETRAADIPLAVDHFRYFAGVIRAEEGSLNEIDNESLSLVLREPIGVVGQIIPWNFPFLMAAWKIAPALAAGNTIVIHPSSSTSLSLLSLGKLINHLLPKGVLNIITGRGSKSGEYMQHHKGFNKLAFTGSTEIGRKIGISAAENLIPSTLELGGKSANIFFDDMPFDKALEGAQKGILFNQGQVCCAGSRIFVQAGIYDRFVKALAEEFKKVKVGLPWEDDTQMGAQVNGGQLDTILKYIKIGEQEGARIITGGRKISGGALGEGAFLEPTLIAADNNDRISQEEIFGPVATVIKFNTEEEVIALANDSIYGLGGAVWTQNINRALRVSKAIQTGRVWVNCYNHLPAGAPFGGYKESGIGRENHKMMLAAYTQVKNIYISTREEREGMY
ncbi:MAG: aldehyde dehydrogenase family protein [Neisseria sp.]|nr:aldehyde dehydrogenase family protein [Neisseria sp.]